MNNKLVIALLSGLADDSATIPYRRRFNTATGSVTASILLQQFLYRFVNNRFKKFYKFKIPCSHVLYNDGDDWLSELGFTRSEFDTALSKIATKITIGKSKGDVMKQVTPESMIIYWTDSSRVTWYDLNLNAIASVLLPLYLDDETEDDFNDLFGDIKQEQSDKPKRVLSPMDALGITAMHNKGNSGIKSLSDIGWLVRSTDVANIIKAFNDITGTEFPSSSGSRRKWVAGAKEILAEFSSGSIALMRQAWGEYYEDATAGRVDIGHPMALKNKMIVIHNRKSLKVTGDTNVVIKDSDGGMYI